MDSEGRHRDRPARSSDSDNPVTGDGHILNGTGDGSALSPAGGAGTNVSDPAFEDPVTGVLATRVASRGTPCKTVGDATPSAGTGTDLTRLPERRVPTASP
jgi:hypothetical protein